MLRQLIKKLPGLNHRISSQSQAFLTSSCITMPNTHRIRHFSTEGVQCSPKVASLVDEITQLNLKEVSELVEELKNQLNLPETSFSAAAMPMGFGMPQTQASAEAAVEEVEEEKPIVNVQLDGFDEANKIKVIKEVKSITGVGLKDAKALVEGAPKVLLENVKREEAAEMLKTLNELGAKVSLI